MALWSRRRAASAIAAVATAWIGAGVATSAQSASSPEALAAAATTLQETIAQLRQAGDTGAEADALMQLADIQQRLNDNRRAVETYQRALSLRRSINDQKGEASALNGIAGSSSRLSDFQGAVKFYREALPLWRTLQDRKGEADALSGIGAAYGRLSMYTESRDIAQQALPLYQALGNVAGEAAALQTIGSADFRLDRYASAIEIFDRALALARAAGSRSLEGSLLIAVGQVHYHLGDYQNALNLYLEALPVSREMRNRSSEATTLSSLGRVYRFLGDYEQALAHHNQAMSIWRVIGEPLNEATTLNNMAHVYLGMRDYRKALPFFERSLEICRTVKNQAGVASNTNGIGLVHAGLLEYDQALPFHHEALRLFRSIGHRRAEADSLGHIGRAYQGLGRYDESTEYLRAALELYREVRVPGQEAETLYAIARSEQRSGDLSAATAALDHAIALVEGLRHDVASQQLRTSYLAKVRDLYELKIDVLLQQGAPDATPQMVTAAFETSERARARTLLDLLAEARTDIRNGVDAALLERERVARQTLGGLAERQTQLVTGTSTPEQRATIASAVAAAATDLEQVQGKIRDSSPRYAALMQPEPLTLAQIQAQVLDRDTVILEYFLGTDRSYLWAVTAGSIAAFQLPRRAEIEAAARRFYDLAKDNAPRQSVQEAGKALSAMVLAPAARELRTKRVAIVADGALHYVPFGALPKPQQGAAQDDGEPLIVQHEVVSLASASTLAILRREVTDRAPAQKLVAVVADPVFDENDVRVRRGLTKATPPAEMPVSHTNLRRAVEDVGLRVGQWPPPRLLGTRREARAILSFAPGNVSQQALDFDASRETATSGALAAFQVIHFATHALINNRHPELSGLVLSLVDKQGKARDGFLRLNDIFNLRLPAELVVLSACQTGLGQEIQGEGLVGLTRGFMYAGSPRLLTSLWQVDDRGTSELMERFYRGLLRQKLTAAEALRQAQIEMWRHNDWKSIYHWASFTLQGEWRPVVTSSVQ